MNHTPLTRPLRRREAILAAAGGLAAAYGLRDLAYPGSSEGAACLLQREVTEGP